jgi:hypothetical protein
MSGSCATAPIRWRPSCSRPGKQYKMNRREAEVSVTMFLQMLHERNFIGFYKKTKK